MHQPRISSLKNAYRRHHHLLRLSSSNTEGSSSDASLPPPNVLCVGEALWDSLPSGIYLGGAPTNVAVHLASLFNSPPSSSANSKPTVAIAACLGNDRLGKEASRRLSLKGVRTDYLQFHERWETGMATAIIDEDGDATYEFITPAAWDGLWYGLKLIKLLEEQQQSGEGIVFVMGTIAGRLKNDHGDIGASSLSTLKKIRNGAKEGSVVLDVNLRSPWYTPETVLELAKGDDVEEGTPKKLALLKLNEEELCLLEQWCGLEETSFGASNDEERLTGSVLKQRMDQLATSLNTQRICVTRGKEGAALWCKGSDGDDNLYFENSGYTLASNSDSDTVGAGDAFLAAIVSSLFIQNESPERALERACALGGYVAGCRGATPEHGDAPDDLRRIFSAE